jgi:hypothetical protein
MLSVPLQTDQHRNPLDIINRLRLRSISKYVDLPEIVIYRDQSAGKSSVLKAISGMKFLTKDNLYTRFTTELALRHEADIGLKITIIPGPNRSDRER